MSGLAATQPGTTAINVGHGPTGIIRRSLVSDICISCCDGCDSFGQGVIFADHTALSVEDSIVQRTTGVGGALSAAGGQDTPWCGAPQRRTPRRGGLAPAPA